MITKVQSQSTFLKEIPLEKYGRNKGHLDFMYQYLREEALELNLDSLEFGFDSLQIRIWLGHSLAIKCNVVILKRSNDKWAGQLLTFVKSHDGKTGKEFIAKREIKDVNPKLGWDNLIKNLIDFNILTLPNADDLQGYNGCGKDGIAYYFEISTKTFYRFYYYCNPNDNINKYWQANSVLKFSDLLEKEFDFTYTK
jgi:hypothetical protein